MLVSVYLVQTTDKTVSVALYRTKCMRSRMRMDKKCLTLLLAMLTLVRVRLLTTQALPVTILGDCSTAGGMLLTCSSVKCK